LASTEEGVTWADYRSTIPNVGTVTGTFLTISWWRQEGPQVDGNAIFAYLVMRSSRGRWRRRGREMDLSIPLILILAWGGSALVIWGIWELAFRSQGKRSTPEITTNESDVAVEIKNLQRELRKL
jgi:hypothetical protein